MKKLSKFLFLFILISSFTACIDEDDFNFDRLAETNIQPSLKAPLINAEITLNDFLNLEQPSDSSKWFEIVQVNESDDSYLEFIFSFNKSFNLTNLLKEIDGIEDIAIDLEDIIIPDISELGFEETQLPEIIISYPDDNVAAEDISFEILNLENGVRIDSLQILSGNLYIQPTNPLPLDAYIELSSNTIRNNYTGELFHKNIQISNVNNPITQSLDISNYTIFLKDSIVNGTLKQFIDLKYRLIFNVSSNPSIEGGNYDSGVRISFSPLSIDALFGDLGNTEFNVCDSVALDFIKEPLFNSITNINKIGFEQFTLNLSTATNIGVDMNIIPNIYTITSDGNHLNILNESNAIHINGASTLGETAYTNDIKIELNANTIEELPEKLAYDINVNFRDEENNHSNFISPDDAFITIDAKAQLPLKAKLKDLNYSIDFDAFDFVKEMDYLKSTALQFYIENLFPIELSVNLYLLNEDNKVFDTLLLSPFTIPGANIDSRGRVINAGVKKTSITLHNSKYESLKKAKTMRLHTILSTSRDAQGNQQFVRFSNEAKIKIKSSVSLTGNFDINL